MTIENSHIDTIFALSSASGKAGVSVIRVSGPKAWQSFAVLAPKAGVTEPNQAKLCKLLNPKTKDVIDYALIIGFKAPASFTGENVIEYHCHGGAAIIDEMLETLSNMENHRLAEPGEFTRRAFDNAKMDLTEAESIADLIDAETLAQKNQALLQMGGALADLYHGWAESLTKSLAYIEAIIDFPDEDVPDSETDKARPALEKIIIDIKEHLNDNRRGERLRSGIQVAIIGAPNAGKSSLVNALVQRDIAIISDLAGTTRDVIESHLNLGGYPVILSDTAGLRPSQLLEIDQKESHNISQDASHDAIEFEGIERALKRSNEADIKILVFDVSRETLDSHTLDLIDDQTILIGNKIDKANDTVRAELTEQSKKSAIFLSVETGEGLQDLLDRLTHDIAQMMKTRSADTPALTRRRHRSALESALVYLNQSLAHQEPDLMAEELRAALREIGRITGRVDVEDLLDVIFRDFCIGK